MTMDGRGEETLYRTLARQLPNTATFIVDDQLRYRVAEGGVLQTLGMRPDQLEGKRVRECVAPDVVHEVEENYRRALRGERWTVEHEVAGRYFETHGIPLVDGGGHIYAALAVSYDVTERKAADALVREALRHNEMIIGVLSHDLRTPLATIATGAELALTLPEHAPEALRRVIASATRMNRMISQLLDLTRMRAGGIPIRCDRTDLAVLVKMIIHEVEYAAPTRKIQMSTLGNIVGWWDPDRIAQVLSNVIGNAAEHAPAGSPIEVRVDGRAASTVSIATNNQGVIAADVRDSLFEPFRRGAGARSGAGLGLGLHIAAEIARAHGGDITVQSDPETGTTFEIRLPRGSAT